MHSPEELKLVATATRRMGLLPEFQEEIIHRAIELNHVTVREIMTPRARMFLLGADLPIDLASARIIEEQHSRVPVFDPLPRPGAVAADGSHCGGGVLEGCVAVDAFSRDVAGA